MERVFIKEWTSALRFKSNCEYVFEKGRYEINAEMTRERFLFVSNNDSGTRKVALLLQGLENVTLDFSGSTLFFKGRISPFVAEDCRGVTLKNFTVEYDRPFFTCGEIIDHGADHAEISIDKEKYPYRIENGTIVAYGAYWEQKLSEGINLFLEMDKTRKRPAYNAAILLPLIGDKVNRHPQPPIPQVIWSVEETERETLLLKGDFSFLTGNNRFVITHEQRMNSIVTAIDCADVVVENVTIRDGGAMGVICQCCENVHLDNVQIYAREDQEYLCSINCDATHFVNCRGKVHLENCRFENMMDDGCNVHGIYTKVTEVGGDGITVELQHFQQFGVPLYRAGDVVEITSPDVVAYKKQATIKAAAMLDERRIRLTFDEMPAGIKAGYIADNTTAFPEVHIHDCRMGDNRPRGVLVTTNKKAVVENCLFYNSDAGVSINGDNSFWWEATAVRDVTVCNNVFDNCGYHCSDFSIVIFADIEANKEIKDYHRNVRVVGNKFITFTGACVYVRNCQNFVFEDNTVIKSTEYKARKALREVEGDLS